MTKLAVTNRDNRGTDEVPFGYVYFNDGKRVVYTAKGARDSSGGWGPVGHNHVAVADDHLKSEGVLK